MPWMKWTGKDAGQIEEYISDHAYTKISEKSQREIDRMDRNAEILRLWGIGISKVKIAKRLSVEWHTVSRVIKEAGEC